MTQYIRPNADVALGSWFGSPSSPLYTNIDEVIPDDGDTIGTSSTPVQSYEHYEVHVHGFYQVPEPDGQRHTLEATSHLQLLRTPRPHRLDPGEKAHVRLEWHPPLDCEHPLVFTLEIEGSYIISPVD